MFLFKRKYDGGSDSGVTGYWLIEIKSLFSIVILRFSTNNRENFHSHAFNALTVWLKGKVIEEVLDKENKVCKYRYFSFGKVKYTPRSLIHKIHCTSTAWAISFRGPWKSSWEEYNTKTNKVITLTHGRKILREESL